jgi:hypothetical protein
MTMMLDALYHVRAFYATPRSTISNAWLIAFVFLLDARLPQSGCGAIPISERVTPRGVVYERGTRPSRVASLDIHGRPAGPRASNLIKHGLAGKPRWVWRGHH